MCNNGRTEVETLIFAIIFFSFGICSFSAQFHTRLIILLLPSRVLLMSFNVLLFNICQEHNQNIGIVFGHFYCENVSTQTSGKTEKKNKNKNTILWINLFTCQIHIFHWHDAWSGTSCTHFHQTRLGVIELLEASLSATIFLQWIRNKMIA